MSILPGLMTVSYSLSINEGKITSEQMMNRAEELGLKSTEWCHFGCHAPGQVYWEEVKRLDKLGREKGIANSIAGWSSLLVEGDEVQTLIGRIRTQLEVSKFIGAKRLRFHSAIEGEIGIGNQPPMDLVIENLKRVVNMGEEEDIVIALENHGDLRVADFRRIFDEIDSPYLRINLDTGNFVPLNEDVVAFAREFAPKIASCHFKAVHYTWCNNGIILTSCPVDKNMINLTAILEVLDAHPEEIPTHVEVIPLTSEENDPLVVDLVNFINAFLKK